MKVNLNKYLACPKCKSSFNVKIFSKDKNEIQDGLLVCSNCKSWFPIENRIPRIISSNIFNRSNFIKKYKNQLNDLKINYNKHSQVHKSTIKSFDTQWERYQKYGYETRHFDFERKLGVKKGDLKNSLVLDIGCGNGRFSVSALDFGAKEVIAIDLISSIEKTSNRLKDKNINFIQTDIMNLPFKEETFNFIFSIGVLHHTQNTKKAFQGLVKFLKKEGRISCTFYKKMHFMREFTDDFIRLFSTRISKSFLWYLSYVPAFFGKIFNFPIYKKKGRLIRFTDVINATIVHLNPDHIVCFDWWSPSNASRQSWKEVYRWYKEMKLKNIKKNDYGAVAFIAEK